MALPCCCIFLVLISCLLFSEAQQSSFRPKAFVLPVSKDPSTLQYITLINQRTPLVPVNLTLDLGGQLLWVDCDQGYVSSSYKPARCGSALCSLAKSKSCRTVCYSTPKPGCNNNTCQLLPDNSVTQTIWGLRDLGQDVVSIQSTDGRLVKVPNLPLSCVPTSLLKGLAKGVTGMAGLGWNKISIPAHFSASFSHFHSKFAVCLSSSNGVVIFGDVVPKMDLTYTPLIFNKVSTASSWLNGDTSSDYFIGVKSIKINGNITVPFNTTLLKINSEGFGGTKISTVQSYTVLHTSIHNPLINAFARQLSKVPRVAAVAPFDLCFDSSGIGSTRVGPAVPRIDLVLQSSNVVWSIFGANSMVEVKKDVICLGFVDGGPNPRTTIVIGGHQVEDNLLQFDLASSRLGFKQTSCANFNFTSIA